MKMQYRKNKRGEDISLLGYGCMRFPKKGNQIDMEETEKQLLLAIEQGINYFDTAYIYPGSEVALGKILAKNNCREKVLIADKLPQYFVRSEKSIEKYFKEHLERLQTTYIDYYLMHMLTDVGAWNKLCGFGIREWIEEKKKSGEIRNIGFSFHGNTETFLKILDAYDWDFCQIQYNYLDEHSQAGVKGLRAAAEKGIPVIIMEPLRGGRLVNMLPKSAKKVIREYPVKRSPAEWSFRWLFSQPEVTCVLSGMNTEKMIRENVKTASETDVGSFTEEDFRMIERIKKEIAANTFVGCTGCGYCMPCPAGVDIPAAFRCYNNTAIESKKTARKEYLQTTAFTKKPSSASQCIGCGKCERHCPQHLPIRKELKNAAKVLETPVYKGAKLAVKVLKIV